MYTFTAEYYEGRELLCCFNEKGLLTVQAGDESYSFSLRVPNHDTTGQFDKQPLRLSFMDEGAKIEFASPRSNDPTPEELAENVLHHAHVNGFIDRDGKPQKSQFFQFPVPPRMGQMNHGVTAHLN